MDTERHLDGDNFMKILNSSLVAAAAIATVVGFGASLKDAHAGTTLRNTCASAAGGITVTESDQVVITATTGNVITISAAGGNFNSAVAIDDASRTTFAVAGPGESQSFTIPDGGEIDVRIFLTSRFEGAVEVRDSKARVVDTGTASCSLTAVSAPPPEELASEEPEAAPEAPSTEDVQRAFSSQGMMNHLGNLYDDVHRNTAGVLNGGGTQTVNENGLFLQSVGKAAKDIPGRQPMLNVFVSAEATNYDGDSFDGLNGAITLGLDYRVSRDIVVGGLVSGSRSDFSTLINSNIGGLESTGLTAGIYGAAKIYGDVSIDGLLTYSGLDYDVANGGTTGSFNASRIGISVGIYNQMPFMGAIFEPHARVIYGLEEQDGYTDSVGRAVGSNTINAGRIILGPRLIAPMENGFTPWIKANAVYEFSDSGSLATGSPDFDDTFSGQVGLGFDWDSDLGRIGAEVNFGGLGSGLYHSVGGTFSYTLVF